MNFLVMQYPKLLASSSLSNFLSITFETTAIYTHPSKVRDHISHHAAESLWS